jgi:hypothetical protein
MNAFNELPSSATEKDMTIQAQQAAQQEAPGAAFQPGSIVIKEVNAALMASKTNRDVAASQVKVMGISATKVINLFSRLLLPVLCQALVSLTITD